MFLQLIWRLPRVAATVSMPRRALDSALKSLGVTAECRGDLMLALNEACANAVEHARSGADYRVTITADSHRCAVEIADCGPGIVEEDQFGRHVVAPASFRGRGMTIIRACTDSLDLAAVEPHGLAVRFSKRLVWEPGARDRLLAPAA